MNSVGIDVSKGKSMVAAMRPFGEAVFPPFEIGHTLSELNSLAKKLKSLKGETRVVLEATGNYHLPIALALHDAGLYVSVVNPILIHDYGNNSLRHAKTDKLDAVKIANYGLDQWLNLREFSPDEESRSQLKFCYRQYLHYSKIKTMFQNNLIALLDTVFPNVNSLFDSPPKDDGSTKWVDFLESFWHCECVSKLSFKAFSDKYQKWCKKHRYLFSETKAKQVHDFARSVKFSLPPCETTRLLVSHAVTQLKTISATLAVITKEMLRLAESLPEYSVVCGMYGVGPKLGPQLMAEIGDVRRFHSKKALVAFAGIDAPPNDSGKKTDCTKGISKIGSAPLRRTLFLVMKVFLANAPVDHPIYQFMLKKQSEGKPYFVYMMASANKFLRIYYASVLTYFDSLNQA